MGVTPAFKRRRAAKKACPCTVKKSPSSAGSASERERYNDRFAQSLVTAWSDDGTNANYSIAKIKGKGTSDIRLKKSSMTLAHP